MNSIDGANAWEQKRCLLPNSLPFFGDYGTLADRSIGHAIGPLTEILIAGYGPSSKEFRMTQTLFRHYLIARQLHDDAHDWAEDLLRGRVTSVGALVIRKFQTEHHCPCPARDAIANALPVMRELFWREVIGEVAQLIERHVAAARRARGRSAIIADKDFMEEELAALEDAARKALAERDDTLLFLARYHPL
jgi:hypothetical protein